MSDFGFLHFVEIQFSSVSDLPVSTACSCAQHTIPFAAPLQYRCGAKRCIVVAPIVRDLPCLCKSCSSGHGVQVMMVLYHHIRVRQAHNSSGVQMSGSCTGCMEVSIYTGAAALAVLHVDALLCHSTVSNLSTDVQLDISVSSLRQF